MTGEMARYLEALNASIAQGGYGEPATYGEARSLRDRFPDDPAGAARVLFKEGCAKRVDPWERVEAAIRSAMARAGEGLPAATYGELAVAALERIAGDHDDGSIVIYPDDPGEVRIAPGAVAITRELTDADMYGGEAGK